MRRTRFALAHRPAAAEPAAYITTDSISSHRLISSALLLVYEGGEGVVCVTDLYSCVRPAMFPVCAYGFLSLCLCVCWLDMYAFSEMNEKQPRTHTSPRAHARKRAKTMSVSFALPSLVLHTPKPAHTKWSPAHTVPLATATN